MTIYYSIYALLGITPVVSKLFNVREDRARKIFCFIAFTSLLLMFALRHQSMGYDLHYKAYFGYLGRFDTIATSSWREISQITDMHYETGYILFNKIVGLIYNDRQFFLGACAFFTILPIIYVIYKKSESPFQSVIIYMGLPVFLLTYSGLRQALAIGLCFFALPYIENKKIFRFAALVLLATTFHRSAIVFIIAYPLYHFKMSKSFRWGTVLLIPIIYALRHPLFTVFSKIFKSNAVTTETGAGTLLLVFVLIYVFSIFYSDESDEQNGLLNLFLFACVCQVFGGIYNTAIRLGYYFMLSLVILLPKVLKSMDKKLDKPLFSTAITVAFAGYGLYWIYISTWARAYPYYFFWEIR